MAGLSLSGSGIPTEGARRAPTHRTPAPRHHHHQQQPYSAGPATPLRASNHRRAATPSSGRGGADGMRRKLAGGGKTVRATPSPLRRRTPHDGTMRGESGRGILKERAHEAVRMKDEQLKVLQQQNRKLLGTITDMEEEVADAKHKLGETETAALRVQDENLQLRTSVQRAEEHGRLEAERHFQQEVEASQHQLRVMAEQNTELLRLLEAEEKRSAGQRSELDAYKARYKEAVGELTSVRGQLDEEISSLKDTAKQAQQRERELLAEMESKDEQARGLRMNVASLEDKLVKVSTSNVELNSRLLDQQRVASEQEEAMTAGVDDAVSDLQSTLASRETELEIERREKGRLKGEVAEQADQLKEMAEKVFQLIDRLQQAEQAKRPAEEAAERVGKEVREAKERILRLETERAAADKQARRFGEELRKSRLEAKSAKEKLGEQTKLHRSEKQLRLREARGRQEQAEARKALAGRVSYLMNKSALDDESRANARVDVKRLETQLQQSLKKNEHLHAQLRRSKEANKVLAESMRVKAEELDKMQVDHQMRTWDKEKAGKRADRDKEEIQNRLKFGAKGKQKGGGGGGAGADGGGGGGGDIEVSGSSLSRGSGYTVFKQLPRGREKPMPGLRAKKDDERAQNLLKKLQVNEFFRYVARRPMEKALDLCAEKFAQVLGTLRMSEAIAAARARRSLDITDRLRAELDLLRRKAADQGDRLFSEEEAKRAALIKYLHEVIGGGAAHRQAELARQDAAEEHARQAARRNDGGTGFLPGPPPGGASKGHDAAAVAAPHGGGGDRWEGEPVTVRLGSSGIGDEEVHALVAVLAAKDRVDLLDLRKNGIGDVGARGLATLLRSSGVLAEVDLRENNVGPTGLRILAEALEHNNRVRHVFVHGNGRIEALGTIGSGLLADGSPDPDAIIDTVITVNVARQQEAAHGAGARTATGGASGTKLKLQPLPARSQLTGAGGGGGGGGGGAGGEKQEGEDGAGGRPKYYTHRQQKERLDEIDAKEAIKRGQEAQDTPLLRKIRDLERNLGPAADGPPPSDTVAEMNAVVEAQKWASRATQKEEERGLDAVDDDWMGTETAPQAYASPLTRRIRALEERLAIADLDGQDGPQAAGQIVQNLTGTGGGEGGTADTPSGGGIRRGNRPPRGWAWEPNLPDLPPPRRRAKSAVPRARRRGPSPGRGPMPSPAWQGNQGPSLLSQALTTKEESINQTVTRKGNLARAQQREGRGKRPSTVASGRKRDRPALDRDGGGHLGTAMGVKLAGAARNEGKHRQAREKEAEAERRREMAARKKEMTRRRKARSKERLKQRT